jgi:hypothetical protein
MRGPEPGLYGVSHSRNRQEPEKKAKLKKAMAKVYKNDR